MMNILRDFKNFIEDKRGRDKKKQENRPRVYYRNKRTVPLFFFVFLSVFIGVLFLTSKDSGATAYRGYVLIRANGTDQNVHMSSTTNGAQLRTQAGTADQAKHWLVVSPSSGQYLFRNRTAPDTRKIYTDGSGQIQAHNGWDERYFWTVSGTNIINVRNTSRRFRWDTSRNPNAMVNTGGTNPGWTLIPIGPPPAPSIASRTATSITLSNAGGGVKYRIAGGVWTTDRTFSGLNPGTTYTFETRYDTNDPPIQPSASVSASLATQAKATQTAPSAPTMASRANTSITLNSLGSGIEYSRGNGVWQTSTLFSGLNPANSFTFTARRVETDTHSASPPSTGTVISTLANLPSITLGTPKTTSIPVIINENGNPSNTSYYLERSTSSGFTSGNTVIRNWVTGTSFTDTGLVPDTTYYYKVKARNADGVETDYSAVVSVKTKDGSLPSTNAVTHSGDGQYKVGNNIDVTLHTDDPMNVNLPLDRVPNAAAAYGLRKLRTGYNGYAVRVRKGTGAEATFMDIGFVNGELDVNALVAFADGGAAFVHTWYDQSGNGNNAVQGTEGNQPQVVSAGVIKRQNGRGTLKFTGNQRLGTSYAVNGNGSYSSFVTAANQRDTLVAGTLDAVFYAGRGGTDTVLAIETYNGFVTTSTRKLYRGDVRKNGNASSIEIRQGEMFVGSAITTVNIADTAAKNLMIGAGYSISAGVAWHSYNDISEIIVYPSALSDINRTAIERNQMQFYGVNQPNDELRPVDKVSSAAAAYGLRKLRSSYDGVAIRVRRDSDNREQDIGFDKNGDLDVAALQSFVGVNSGFVSIWYDQSGNGRHAVQANSENQPRIVNVGTVYTYLGKPSIYFNGTSSVLTTSNNPIANSDNATVNMVGSSGLGRGRDGFGSGWSILMKPSEFRIVLVSVGATGYTRTNSGAQNGIYTGTVSQNSPSAGNTTFDFFSDGLSVAGPSTVGQTTFRSSTVNFQLGMVNTGYAEGYLSEINIYPSALSTTNRTAIEASQMGYYLNGQSKVIPPLDAVDRPAAAYGLRKLTAYYNGPAIRVRRDSDNTESDMGFDAMGDLNTKALLEFVGSGNGFVSVWYDQSGNGRHASSNNPDYQPKIVNAGVMIIQNGRPAIYADSSRFIVYADMGIASGQDRTALTVLGHYEDKTNSEFFGTSTGSMADINYHYPSGTYVSQRIRLRHSSGTDYNVVSAGGTVPFGVNQLSILSNNVANKTYVWNKGVNIIDTTAIHSNWAIGTNLGILWANFDTRNFKGYMSEFVLYPSALSDTNRTAIEASQMAYFGINQPSPTVRPLDAVGSAAAAYGLRKLSSSYTGDAITVRRSSDDATMDIGFGYSGELDTNALLEFVGASKPLDYVKNAAVAYSLRKLNSDYTGYAIRVRRSSDNGELNIGFNEMGGLDTKVLMGFAGSDTATVVTWYDQSGNGRHATVEVGANPPVIVLGGILVTQEGMPAVDFMGNTQNYLQYDGDFFVDSPYSIFTVEAREDNENNRWILGGSDSGQNKNLSIGYFDPRFTFTHTNQNTTFGDIPVFSGQKNEQSSLRTRTLGRDIFRNGVKVGEHLDPVSLLVGNDGASIGRRVSSGDSTYYNGKISEIIMYSEYLSDVDRKTIEASQGRYYAVEGLADAYVVKWYDQSGNERHAEQETEGNQPMIVSSGKVEMQNGQPTFTLSGNQWMDVVNAPNHATGLTVNSVGKTSAGFRLLQAGNGVGLTTGNYAVGRNSLIIAGGYADSPLILESPDLLVFTGKWDGTYITNYKNGSIIAPESVMNATKVGDKVDPTANPVDATQTMRLFARNHSSGTTGVITGNISEIIIHSTALSDNQRTAIEASQMHYFNLHRTMENEPYLTLNINGSPRKATYLRGSGSNALTFRYTVQPGDESVFGITIGNEISLGGGTIKDQDQVSLSPTIDNVSSTENVLVNGASPVVAKVTLPSGRVYKDGENIDIKVRMNEAVNVNLEESGTKYRSFPHFMTAASTTSNGETFNVSASSNRTTDLTAWKAFDGVEQTTADPYISTWQSSDNRYDEFDNATQDSNFMSNFDGYKGEWLKVVFPYPVKISSYQLGGDPYKFRIYGNTSSDLSDNAWVMVDDREITPPMFETTNTYLVTDTNVLSQSFYAMALKINKSFKRAGWGRSAVHTLKYNGYRNIEESGTNLLPLDKAKGAAAAYGLRKLQESYDGPLVKVRKGLDANLRLEDFYPDREGMLSLNSKNANGVTLSTWLATVPAATDAFVHTWYDQSGNGRDAAQATPANQPQVVSGGKIEMQNGRPSIYLNGSQNLAGTISFANSKISIFALAKYNATSSTQVVFGLGADGTNIGLGLNQGGYTNYFKWAEWPEASHRSSNSSFNVYSGVRDTSTKIYVNGVVGNESAFNDFVPNPSFTIGKHVQSTNPYWMTGYISEIIVYPSALSDTNRQSIEASQMKYFNINGMKDHDPRLRVDIGGKIRYARYIEGSGTDTLIFRYTLQRGDHARNGITVDTSTGVIGGVLNDQGGNPLMRKILRNSTSNTKVNTNKVFVK
jgi:chitodextrinase